MNAKQLKDYARKINCNTCRYCSHIDKDTVACDHPHINGHVVMGDDWMMACPDYSGEDD